MDFVNYCFLIHFRNDQKDEETAHTLVEVGGDISGSTEGIEAVLEILMSHVPQAEPETADTVWTVDSLLCELSEGSS